MHGLLLHPCCLLEVPLPFESSHLHTQGLRNWPLGRGIVQTHPWLILMNFPFGLVIGSTCCTTPGARYSMGVLLEASWPSLGSSSPKKFSPHCSPG